MASDSSCGLKEYTLTHTQQQAGRAKGKGRLQGMGQMGWEVWRLGPWRGPGAGEGREVGEVLDNADAQTDSKAL